MATTEFNYNGVSIVFRNYEIDKFKAWLNIWRAAETRWHIRISLEQILAAIEEDQVPVKTDPSKKLI